MGGHFPIQCNDPATGTSRTVWVRKLNALGLEPNHETFEDRRGRTYKRDVSRPHGVVAIEAADLEIPSTDESPVPVTLAPDGVQVHGGPFAVTLHGDGQPQTVQVFKHAREDGTEVFSAADDSGRVFERRSNGLSGVVEIGA